MRSPPDRAPTRTNRRSSLVPLLFAYLTACVISVVGYYLLRSVGVAEVHAATIPSSIAFLNVAPLSRAYRRGTFRELVMRDWLALPDRVVAPQSYVLDWPIAAGLGAAWLVASINVGRLVGSAGIQVLGAASSVAIGAGEGAALVTGLVAAFVLGRWIGSRTWEDAGVAVVISVAIGRIFAGWPTLMTTGGQLAILGELGDRNWWMLSVCWLVIAFAGLWRGRRLRSSAYVAFLASTLVPTSREALVDLAYQEARVLETESDRRALAAGIDPRNRPWWHRLLW